MKAVYCMKATVTGACAPFKPINRQNETLLPYVSRISVDADSFSFEWFDKGFEGEHILTVYKQFDGEEVLKKTISESPVTVDGLISGTDYRFTVERVGMGGRVTRRVIPFKMPGDTVINYLHPKDGTYSFSGTFLGSPTIVRCPSGKLLAAHDVFCKEEWHSMLSFVMESKDNGLTWHYVTELAPFFWPKLFVAGGKVYCIAASHCGGNLIIARSEDEGYTWSAPVILATACHKWGIVTCPTSMAVSKGRIYKEFSVGEWGNQYFDMAYISAPVDSDLLDPANWTISDTLRYTQDWPNSPAACGPGFNSPGGGIEGNMIVGPDDKLHCCYRMDIAKAFPRSGKFLLLDLDETDPDSPFKFNEIVDCAIGSNSKFYIERDEKTGKYIMIGNKHAGQKLGRTVLSMAVSDDLKTWEIVCDLFDYSGKDAGIQYPSFIIDGDDILLVLRIGYAGAAGGHDSNCITFKRVENFRRYFN